ncbi:alpha/beta hydrolase [Nocardia sp. NPDC051030]|uniref:alpha/beta hydrolase n=1 Tax=Nocardia sp. NPDC051030 TaxID=3155162 RepID=UPI00341B9B1E
MPSPEMQDVFTIFLEQRAARATGGTPPPLDVIRAGFAPAGQPHSMPVDVEVTEVSAAGVPSYWVDAPGTDSARVLLYVHGGGFAVGSLNSHGELAARLGRVTGRRVLFPEYRLAPENPFPAGVDDVQAVWRWLRADQEIPAKNIVVAGDSAGGGLLVTLMLFLRDNGEDQPAAAVLLSPTVDLTFSGQSVTDREGEDPIFTPDMLHGIGADYLNGADPTLPAVSPLFADLTGLPPLLIQVGSAELLLSDSERFAESAAAAGVDVTLEVGEGLPHVYPLMLGTPEAAAATDQIGKFLAAH